MGSFSLVLSLNVPVKRRGSVRSLLRAWLWQHYPNIHTHTSTCAKQKSHMCLLIYLLTWKKGGYLWIDEAFNNQLISNLIWALKYLENMTRMQAFSFGFWRPKRIPKGVTWCVRWFDPTKLTRMTNTFVGSLFINMWIDIVVSFSSLLSLSPPFVITVQPP